MVIIPRKACKMNEKQQQRKRVKNSIVNTKSFEKNYACFVFILS